MSNEQIFIGIFDVIVVFSFVLALYMLVSLTHLSMMPRLFVPKPGLFDTVYPFSGAKDIVDNRRYDELIPVRRIYGVFRCEHHWTGYNRVDHRAGPGSFADNFQGVCCYHCGRILTETQTL